MATIFNLPFADVGSGIKPPDGAKLFFYETGTDTPKNTWTTAAANVANSNPVIASSTGVFPSIYLTGEYWATLKDKNNTQKWAGVLINSSSSVIGVNNVAALRNLEPSSNFEQIDLLGHTNTGLGGGDFYYDISDTTSADNNGTIIVTVGGKRWKRFNFVRLTPYDFGGLGGGANDTVAIQACLNNKGVHFPFISEGWSFTTLTIPLNSTFTGDRRSSIFPDVETAVRLIQIAGTTGWAITDDNSAAGFTGRKGGWYMDGVYVQAAFSSEGALYTNNTHRWEIGSARFRGGKRAVLFVDTFDVTLGTVRLADSQSGYTCLGIQASGNNDNSNNMVFNDLTIEGFKGRPLEIIGQNGDTNQCNKIYFNKMKIETVQSAFNASEFIYMANCNDINLGRTDCTLTAATNIVSGFQYLRSGGRVGGVYGQLIAANTNNTSTINAIIGTQQDISSNTSNIALNIGINISDISVLTSIVHVSAGTLSAASIKVVREGPGLIPAINDGSLPIFLFSGTGSVNDDRVSFTDGSGIKYAIASNNVPTFNDAMKIKSIGEPRLEFRKETSAGALSSEYQVGRIDPDNVFKILGFVSGVTGEQTYIRINPGDNTPDGNTRNFCTGENSASFGGWNSGHLQLGKWHLWVDTTGDLRIKGAAPTLDTDGTVVGSQS
jgi:hypothetical protein